MANEIAVSFNITASKNGAQFSKSGSDSITMTGTYMSVGVELATTSDGTIPLGAIGTIGWIYIKNLDGTNYISIGGDGSTYPLVILPGEFLVARWNAAAIHCKAHTASCLYEFGIIEN